MNKKIEIVFEPGCFDDFEGTQEELDEMIKEITRLAESGEIWDRAVPVDFEDADTLNLIDNPTKRTLQ